MTKAYYKIILASSLYNWCNVYIQHLIDGCGISNKAHAEFLQEKSKVMLHVYLGLVWLVAYI